MDVPNCWLKAALKIRYYGVWLDVKKIVIQQIVSSVAKHGNLCYHNSYMLSTSIWILSSYNYFSYSFLHILLISYRLASHHFPIPLKVHTEFQTHPPRKFSFEGPSLRGTVDKSPAKTSTESASNITFVAFISRCPPSTFYFWKLFLLPLTIPK